VIPFDISRAVGALADAFDEEGWTLTLIAFEQFQRPSETEYQTFTGKVAGVHYIGRRLSSPGGT
jgi:hypothetical protein